MVRAIVATRQPQQVELRVQREQLQALLVMQALLGRVDKADQRARQGQQVKVVVRGKAAQQEPREPPERLGTQGKQEELAVVLVHPTLQTIQTVKLAVA